MTPDQWTAVSRLFDAAADRPAAEREALLAGATPEVRAEVKRLLALDAAAGDLPDLHPERPPPEAGPWRLAERVGEGGMGEVWRAERRDGAFEQTVAVKLVRPGLAPDLLARFRAERRALARLAHPAIARLLDGGTASDGRPYLALEYVRGEPITAYCDRHRLDVPARLRLFEQVCEAVAYAHRQLVVHRDLKPSNVLVAEGEGGPRVTLLDFGIAKLLDADDADHSVPLTAADRRLMTPEYAAPEQVRGEPVTTATDVYALGVLLYELLTGARPYGVPGRVRAAVERAILEAAPTQPSTAVTDAAAAARATAPDRLRRRLRGDLDQVVLTALRKEPERRYRGAGALGRDVARHLAGLPVEARPASAAYRAAAFVRRHRLPVALAAAALALLAAYGVTAALQARRIAAERDRAEAVTELLVGLFDGGDPAVAQGDTLTALALLDAAAARLDTSLADQPALRARLQLALGRIFLNQGAFGRADSLLQDALGWQRRAGADADRLATLDAAAEADYWLGRYADGERKHREALAAERRRVRPPHPVLVHRLDRLALARTRQGDYRSARRYYAQALAQQRRLAPPGDPSLARLVAAVATLDEYEGAFDLSVRRHRWAVAALERALGPRHPDVVMERRDLARALHLAGETRAAARLAEAVHRANVALYGEGHPTVGNTLGELSRYQLSAGDARAAEATAREGLRLIRQIYGGGHQYVANNLLHVAAALREQGRLGEASALAGEALAIHRATLGVDHPFTAASHGHVARLAALQGDRATALRHERTALRLFVDAYGERHPRTDTSRARLRRLLAQPAGTAR